MDVPQGTSLENSVARFEGEDEEKEKVLTFVRGCFSGVPRIGRRPHSFLMIPSFMT